MKTENNADTKSSVIKRFPSWRFVVVINEQSKCLKSLEHDREFIVDNSVPMVYLAHWMTMPTNSDRNGQIK